MNVQIGLVDLLSHPSPGIQRKFECVVINRQANKAVKRERHPIPTVKELMDNMDGAVKYSKVDLKAGYHQIYPLPRNCSQLQLLQHIKDYLDISDCPLASLQPVKFFKMQFKELSKD